MIENDDQLRAVVEAANDNLQAIQLYLNQKNHPDGKIRFPRGFLRTATQYRSRLGFIKSDTLKTNLSYTLILSDVLRWLLNRTDLAGTAKEMVIKNAIILRASICESMAIHGTKGTIGKKHSFCERTNRMAAKGIVTSDLCDELHWLWEKRTGIHIYELDHQEYEKYEIADYNRAVSVTKDLRDALEEYHRS
ncbi:MAG: hypothetical protein E8D40_11770 [Nitrospira sp.]|nr:MAG: hypothetical protein E8D40_11770 [Nitrospira sp.]